MWCTEAAVELLIGHRLWLFRRDFLGEFIECFEGVSDAALVAFVDWSGALEALEAGRLACSSSEAQVLRVAASLSEGVAVDLREAVCGLDVANAMLMARALLQAAGHDLAARVIAVGRR